MTIQLLEAKGGFVNTSYDQPMIILWSSYDQPMMNLW